MNQLLSEQLTSLRANRCVFDFLFFSSIIRAQQTYKTSESNNQDQLQLTSLTPSPDPQPGDLHENQLLASSSSKNTLVLGRALQRKNSRSTTGTHSTTIPSSSVASQSSTLSMRTGIPPADHGEATTTGTVSDEDGANLPELLREAHQANRALSVQLRMSSVVRGVTSYVSQNLLPTYASDLLSTTRCRTLRNGQIDGASQRDQVGSKDSAAIWLDKARARFAIEDAYLADRLRTVDKSLQNMRIAFARLLEWRDAHSEVGFLLERSDRSVQALEAGSRYLTHIESSVLYPLERLSRSILNAQGTLKRRHKKLNLIVEGEDIAAAKKRQYVKRQEQIRQKLGQLGAMTAPLSGRRGTSSTSRDPPQDDATPQASASDDPTNSPEADLTVGAGEGQQNTSNAAFRLSEEDEAQQIALAEDISRWQRVLVTEREKLEAFDDAVEHEVSRFQSWLQKTLLPCADAWEESLRNFGSGLAAVNVAIPR
ncbi:unnamed protein product [Amoebophrya sp. A25]|nr:unnamed protein product [Amoebophrya sp. A25]|eukprot:GSA25T00002230001.1